MCEIGNAVKTLEHYVFYQRANEKEEKKKLKIKHKQGKVFN
jgi:hypothetical protein